MRSIVRNGNGASYEQFLTGLAKASGIDTPMRDDLARIDKKRKTKASNDDWHNPHDSDAKITKRRRAGYFTREATYPGLRANGAVVECQDETEHDCLLADFLAEPAATESL